METSSLERSGGRIAYEVRGTGRLVVCSPGLGDLRSTFDAMADALVAAGCRVVLTDLRGMGESSAHWPSYGEEDVAEDLLALVTALGDGPAVLVGNSYSAGAAVVAAASAPERVSGLVLTGPFVRDQPATIVSRLSTAVLALPLAGRRVWLAYWPTLFGRRPADLTARRRALAANLAEPGRFASVVAMARASHAAAARALPAVRCPALVVMGGADPDFPDPAAEAAWVAEQLGGAAEVAVVAGVGHYPQAEAAADVAGRVVACLEKWEAHPCPA